MQREDQSRSRRDRGARRHRPRRCGSSPAPPLPRVHGPRGWRTAPPSLVGVTAPLRATPEPVGWRHLPHAGLPTPCQRRKEIHLLPVVKDGSHFEKLVAADDHFEVTGRNAEPGNHIGHPGSLCKLQHGGVAVAARRQEPPEGCVEPYRDTHDRGWNPCWAGSLRTRRVRPPIP